MPIPIPPVPPPSTSRRLNTHGGVLVGPHSSIPGTDQLYPGTDQSQLLRVLHNFGGKIKIKIKFFLLIFIWLCYIKKICSIVVFWVIKNFCSMFLKFNKLFQPSHLLFLPPYSCNVPYLQTSNLYKITTCPVFQYLSQIISNYPTLSPIISSCLKLSQLVLDCPKIVLYYPKLYYYYEFFVLSTNALLVYPSNTNKKTLHFFVLPF